MMSKRKVAVAVAFLLVASALVAAQQQPSRAATRAPDTLLVSGEGSSVTFSPAEFKTLPHVSLTVHNAHTDATETYSGVALAVLLEKVDAPLGKQLHGQAMMSYVVATGSDGYAVVLSLAEADPEFHQGQVIVADSRDGQALGKNGPFQLIVSDDKRPARWVHNLTSVTLQRAQ